MKRITYLIAVSLMMILASCDEEIKLYDVAVQVKLPENAAEMTLNGANVRMTAGEAVYEAVADENGNATFTVPNGIYSIAASMTQALAGNYYALNATKEGLVIDNAWNPATPVVLEMVVSKSSQVIIKEIYTGGSTNPETQDTEAWDKYLTLYNNSPYPATLSNFGIGSNQSNAYAMSFMGIVDESGQLLYTNEDWLPLTHGYYYFPEDLVIEPYSDIVIALCGAIDHTQTNSASVDLSEADYVCYDPECGYNHKYYHPAPSEKIPSSHYLKGVRYGLGNSWMFSMSTPSFYLFQTEGVTPADFYKDESLNVYPPKFQNNMAFISKKMKRDWVMDAVEVFSLDYAGENMKRMTTDLDAGYVYHTTDKGYSVYRNVDKAATEAIAENEGKLVYGYKYGTADIEHGTTDSSDIDAEASLKNGAKIVYMDTNNSTQDFHLRKEAAQRNK